jgi:hypothetical protein
MTRAAEARDQSNPAKRVNIKFADQLKQTREDLARFSKLHPDFLKQCFAAIDDGEPAMSRPSVGESFAHLVAKGLTLDDEDRRVLAAAGLAMFGYTVLVDHEIDKNGYLDGRASIAASALLSWGIATGGRYAAGTPYADVFLHNVSRAFAGQYEDISFRSNPETDRHGSDVDKNRAVVALIAAFTAAARDSNNRLIRSVEALLESFQILDDLADIEEDLGQNNLTGFVRMFKERAGATVPTTRAEIYRTIMNDPRAQTTLERTKDGIEKALLLLNPGDDQAMIAYLGELHDGTIVLIEALDDYRRNPSPIKEPEIMRRIEQVATGSS